MPLHEEGGGGGLANSTGTGQVWHSTGHVARNRSPRVPPPKVQSSWLLREHSTGSDLPAHVPTARRMRVLVLASGVCWAARCLDPSSWESTPAAMALAAAHNSTAHARSEVGARALLVPGECCQRRMFLRVVAAAVRVRCPHPHYHHMLDRAPLCAGGGSNGPQCAAGCVD